MMSSKRRVSSLKSGTSECRTVVRSGGYHDRLSNPSLFADRARTDVRVDPLVNRDDPEYVPEDFGTVDRQPSVVAETYDRDDTHYTFHNRNLPVTTRPGRGYRTNTNPDFDYTGFFAMSSLPPSLNVPTDVPLELARQASQAWSVAMSQQVVCVVLGLQPSPFAFIHRRTGTFYVFHPNVGTFVAEVNQ